MTKMKLRILAVFGLVVLSLALVGGVALANNHTDGTRPGWGFGDKNHEHTGPPGGPSVHPVHGD